GHTFRRTEQCGQCLAIAVSILRAAGNIPRTIVDDVSARERRHSSICDLDDPVDALIGNEYLAFLVHDDILGLDELCRGDRALCVDRAPFSFIRLTRDECDRAGGEVDLPHESAEAVRAKNDITLRIDRHAADLIRENKFSVWRL